MVSRCWLLDCCVASLLKLRTTFPGIASPLHRAGIDQRRNWKRSSIHCSPSCSQTRQQADGKDWEDPQVRGPPTVALRPTAAPWPTARFLATGLQRRELLRATTSQKIFTLCPSRSRGGSRKWSDIQLSSPDCPPMVHDPLTTRLSLWDFSFSHYCAMP